MADEHSQDHGTDSDTASGSTLPWMLIPLIPSIIIVVYFLVTGKIGA